MRGHYVRRDRLQNAVEAAVRDSMADTGYSEDERRIVVEKVRARVDSYLATVSAFPEMIGATQAAKVLGIHAPHLARLRDQRRLPDTVPVKGGNDVYLLDEIKALAGTLQGERAARQRRRGAKA